MDSVVLRYLEYLCPRLNKGCCCTSLRKGSIIALSFSIVYGVINIINSICRFYIHEILLKWNILIGNDYFDSQFVLWAYFAFYVIWTLTCIKILYTISNDTYDDIVLMIWILMTIIYCTMSFGEMAFTVVYYSEKGYLNVLILGLVYFTIQPASLIYFTIVLIRYWSELKENQQK